MNSKELQLIIKCGETSTVQFKERFPNQDSIAAEMVAMSNARGGNDTLRHKRQDGRNHRPVLSGITGTQPELFEKGMSFLKASGE